MASQGPEFSLLLPAKAGMPYLLFSVKSVLSETRKDFELIVSVESRETESHLFLSTIQDSRLVVLVAPEGLSMSEHWDWVQSHASGRWQMFVGQDDGIQPHFFELAAELIAVAEKFGIRAIASSRAYLHWAGSRFDQTGHGRLIREVRHVVQIRDLKIDAMSALLGPKSYFDLPQMYTTSIFRSDLIDEVRAKQGGIFLTCHPQDANLAALAIALERKYLFSGVPLGWVGTSPKSAGVAISDVSAGFGKGRERNVALASSYFASVENSKFEYPTYAGNFLLGDLSIYLWQAIRKTEELQDVRFRELMCSKVFVRKLVAKSWATVRLREWSRKKSMLFELASSNDVRVSVSFALILFFFVIREKLKGVAKFFRVLRRRVGWPQGSSVLFGGNESNRVDPDSLPFREGRVPLPRLRGPHLRLEVSNRVKINRPSTTKS